MSVVSIRPLLNEWTCTATVEGRNLHREYSAGWCVVFDTLADGPKTAMYATGVSIKSAYAFGGESDEYARCYSMTASRVENQPAFEVFAKWSTNVDRYENPLDLPPVKKWGLRKYTEDVKEDVVTNKIICNTAGDPLDPPAQRMAGSLYCNYQDNVPFTRTIDVDISDYAFTVNDDEWNGYAAEKVLITDLQGDEAFAMVQDQQIHYWHRTIEFDLPPAPYENWRVYAFDMGFRQKIADKRVPISGLQAPAFLKNGLVLPEDQDPVFIQPGGQLPKQYILKDFEGLNITL